MTQLRLVLLALVAVLAAACASGPRLSEVSSGFPGLKAGEARIYFYRSNSMFGAALQPSIYVNGKVVGTSKPGGFFYADVPAGNVEVTTGTEVEKKATFVVAAGETRYIRTTTGLGLLVGRVYPEIVDTRTAQEEIKDAKYTGSTK